MDTNDRTVSTYIKYLCNAFAFYKVRRYDIQGKRYLASNDKYYLSDHSFKYARLGTKNLDYGRMMENLVAVELLRRGYELYAGVLYKKEIDFVAIKRNEKLYIQVANTVDDPDTFEREVSPLMKIADAYPKLLIARTRHGETVQNGVRVVDIVRWLAGDEGGRTVAARIRNRVRQTLSRDFRSVADVNGRGRAKFDFLANGGLFTVEAGGDSFVTSWSEAGANSVYAYKDRVELLGVKPGVREFPDSVDAFEEFDFTRRASQCAIGDIAVFMNRAGRFLAVKIVDVQVVSRGADRNRLEFEYRVY